MNTFPKNFFWGASTSAHQVEGNAHNNWSVWEKKNAQRLATEARKKWQPWQQAKFPEMFLPSNYISGHAADHYNRYEEDFDLAQKGGHNAQRISVDWARIEPEEGIFDKEAIAHYVNVVQALRKRHMEPFVTLWHWTHAMWLEERGGVLAEDFAKRFAMYAEVMTKAFGDTVTYYVTINEPMSVIASQYVTGAWPHTAKGLRATLTAYRHLADAHTQAYVAMKKLHPKAQVGFTEIVTSLEQRVTWSPLDWLIVRVARYWANERLIKMTKGQYDFLGVQYYFHYRLGVCGVSRTDKGEFSDLGWQLYARGLGSVIRSYARYGVPLFVTEDGLADRDDTKRQKYLREHVAQVAQAIADGCDVRGYFHWSLMDNFEWDKGFWPRFGLVEIDFDTYARIPRPSFWHYKSIITQNGLVPQAKNKK